MVKVTSLFEDNARKDPPILGFFGEYRFLSNFHLCICSVDGVWLPSSEHAYMYQKTYDTDYRERIINAITPKEARKIGQTAKLRSDWHHYRKIAMFNALHSKFKNIVERQLLKATGDAYLEETNTWGDTYWGVCNGIGENILGKLLMNIRNTL